VVEEIGSVVVLYNVMSQARGGETLHPPRPEISKATGKLTLEMKATGDLHDEKSKQASFPTRLVALSNLKMVLSLRHF